MDLPLRVSNEGLRRAARCASIGDQQAAYPSRSELVFSTLPGMAPVSVLLRPSSEHILIVRAPGAKNRCGCHSRVAVRLGLSPNPVGIGVPRSHFAE